MKKPGRHCCPECDFCYATRELARKCEDWCRTHHSCNLELAKKALVKK